MLVGSEAHWLATPELIRSGFSFLYGVPILSLSSMPWPNILQISTYEVKTICLQSFIGARLLVLFFKTLYLILKVSGSVLLFSFWIRKFSLMKLQVDIILFTSFWSIPNNFSTGENSGALIAWSFIFIPWNKTYLIGTIQLSGSHKVALSFLVHLLGTCPVTASSLKKKPVSAILGPTWHRDPCKFS